MTRLDTNVKGGAGGGNGGVANVGVNSGANGMVGEVANLDETAEDVGVVSTDFVGAEMPEPSEYLRAKQRDGKPNHAEKIYKETWRWLAERGCEKLINPRLVESYAMSFARYMQCEDAMTNFGLIGKHPTTGGAVSTPFAAMSREFYKQSNFIWLQIYQIVKENCSVAVGGNPNDDLMERILLGKV